MCCLIDAPKQAIVKEAKNIFKSKTFSQQDNRYQKRFNQNIKK
jgi:hypothetical protein